jgi:hypothetical protein
LKAPLDFDPERCDYGPATQAVRRIVVDWARIDWFVRPQPGAEARAVRLFEEHNFLGRLRMPERFPERPTIDIARGGWPELHALCARVRDPEARWDWKFGALKKLNWNHSREHGWSLSEHAKTLGPGAMPRPGDLFVRVTEDIVIWGRIGPSLNLRDKLPREAAEDASFYLGYANTDAMDAPDEVILFAFDR